MLVEEIDILGAQPARREPSTRSRIFSGRLALSVPTCFPSLKRKPNLVAITTWSRQPLNAG